MKTLFLIRHAEPDTSRRDIPYRTAPGPGLSERGQKQAQQIAEALVGLPIEHVFVSPFQRTLETAAPLLARLELAHSAEELIAEIAPDEPEVELEKRMHLLLEKVATMPYHMTVLISHQAPLLTCMRLLRTPAANMLQVVWDSFTIPMVLPVGSIWRANQSEQGRPWTISRFFAP